MASLTIGHYLSKLSSGWKPIRVLANGLLDNKPMTTGRPITNGLTFETLYRPSSYVTCLGPK
ncbi:hypothetical protein RchiOBHm_Chr1g0320741 [Rosa chinensis]|uniref:Uncharacterized protein n=1 Tax=Rosa chinensis TaxID=74649 RepID=A0A2P6S8W4_ROSCH|nr:hypothetical protein RchiOBHm_Chr1g0320741 [Rosa chinensis]